jgi:hypothetical protein
MSKNFMANEILKMSIDEANASLDEKQHIIFDSQFKLLGEDSSVDSLTLVRLIIAVEENILLKTKKDISVVDENILSEETNPFSSINSLLQHIEVLIN